MKHVVTSAGIVKLLLLHVYAPELRHPYLSVYTKLLATFLEEGMGPTAFVVVTDTAFFHLPHHVDENLCFGLEGMVPLIAHAAFGTSFGRRVERVIARRGAKLAKLGYLACGTMPIYVPDTT